MKKNPTKRALLASVFSLVLCLVMLLGTTFAWFTDTASTAVNKIVSGKLVVDIVKADDETASLRDKTMSFVNVDGSSNILWEPGATFKTPAFKIKSTGTLALKYKLALTGVTDLTANGEKSLLDVIRFSVVDENGNTVDLSAFEGHLTPAAPLSGALYIQGTMDQTAGNDYQEMELNGIGITVVATQDAYEKDSKDENYDKNADYPEVQPVTSADDLKDALAADDINGKTLKLYDDMDVGTLEVANKDVAIDLNGNTMNTARVQINNSTVVIKDSAENGQLETKDSYGVINAVNSNVTIEGGNFVSTFDKTGSSGYANVIQVRNSELTINGGHFENNNNVGSYNYIIKAPSYSKTEKTTITINGGEFVSHRDYGYIVSSDSDANVEVVINGGTFTTTGRNSYLTKVSGNVVVNDCAFTATGNNTVFEIPKDSTVTVKGGTFSVNENSYTDASLAGLIFHRKTNGWTSVSGTLLVDPTTAVKVNQPTYSGFIATGATQSAKGADGFYTISK